MRVGARKKIDQLNLDENLIYKNLRALFPKINDYSPSESGYSEELSELRHFGIHTNKQLRLLLKKHRKEILTIDKSPLDQQHQEIYSHEFGAKEVADCLRKNYWFAYPGLLRLALELEFGDTYEKFADARDGI